MSAWAVVDDWVKNQHRRAEWHWRAVRRVRACLDRLPPELVANLFVAADSEVMAMDVLQVAWDWLEERGIMPADASDLKRPMTRDEQELVDALNGCRFAPGSYDNRFAATMYDQLLLRDTPIISASQAAMLAVMAQRYRKQLGPPTSAQKRTT